MRELVEHKVNECNSNLAVHAVDEAGNGGASHDYVISGFRDAEQPYGVPTELKILFQNGPIAEVGTNGVTHEALLAILIDRLRGFQSGKFACRENALALTKLEEAMHWLLHRARQRMDRGVEGTHKV